MKIPTLIGLAFIIALIGSFGFWFLNQGTAPGVNFEVTDLQIANISTSNATVVWQTNLPSSGKVVYGESWNLNLESSDNRDSDSPSARKTHFVTLKNLKPNTHYFYKIINNSSNYPPNPLEFKTANLKDSNELNFSFLKPIKGTILSTTLNPVDESLIFLKIPGAQELATFSSTAGNFILPLKLVLDQDLTKIFNIPQNTQATMVVKNNNLESKVKIVISDSTINLPPITIGTSLDLTKYVNTPITKISIQTTSPASFDFNSDGKINSLDLAILREKASSRNLPRPEDISKFDINSDGVIDLDDTEVFSKSLIN